MEAILKFNLDEADDAQSHRRCMKATDMALVLFEIHYNLRRRCDEDANKIFDGISELMEEHNINLEEIIT